MKNNFLKWWLLNATVFVCFAIASYFGLLKEIYLKDSSFLTFVIMLLYFANSGYNGYLAWNIDKGAILEEEESDTGWFVSEICLSLGMIGTVIGFIQMLSLICGNLLKFQCFMLEKNLGKKKEKECQKTETMDHIQAS